MSRHSARLRRVTVTPRRRGTFGNWLKAKREERYKTQAAALADMRRLQGLAIAPSEYAQWESGSRVPRPDNPKVLGLFEFFGGRPDEEPVPPPPTDQSALVAALHAQTIALGKIAEAIQHRAESNAQLAAAVMRRLDNLEAARQTDFEAFVEAIGERLLPLADAVRALSAGSESGDDDAAPQSTGTRGQEP